MIFIAPCKDEALPGLELSDGVHIAHVTHRLEGQHANRLFFALSQDPF